MSQFQTDRQTIPPPHPKDHGPTSSPSLDPYVEFYQAGVWKPIRLQEPTTITQQSLGNGDGTETVFGPLNSGNTAFPVPSAAQNVIVLVENVFQLATTIKQKEFHISPLKFGVIM